MWRGKSIAVFIISETWTLAVESSVSAKNGLRIRGRRDKQPVLHMEMGENWQRFEDDTKIGW